MYNKQKPPLQACIIWINRVQDYCNLTWSKWEVHALGVHCELLILQSALMKQMRFEKSLLSSERWQLPVRQKQHHDRNYWTKLQEN